MGFDDRSTGELEALQIVAIISCPCHFWEGRWSHSIPLVKANRMSYDTLRIGEGLRMVKIWAPVTQRSLDFVSRMGDGKVKRILVSSVMTTEKVVASGSGCSHLSS